MILRLIVSLLDRIFLTAIAAGRFPINNENHLLRLQGVMFNLARICTIDRNLC